MCKRIDIKKQWMIWVSFEGTANILFEIINLISLSLFPMKNLYAQEVTILLIQGQIFRKMAFSEMKASFVILKQLTATIVEI